MIQPTQPWPKAASHADKLSELIASGDIGRVRDYFDSLFWEGRKERPDWSHLRIALLREDRPMLRLLHTWGAKPSDAELTAFKTAARDKYTDYMKLLRSAGFRPENAWWEDISNAEPKPDRNDIKKRAYEIFVASGSIAGRDTDNWLQAEKELIEKMRADTAKALEKAAHDNEQLLAGVHAEKTAADELAKVPREWKQLVKAFQAGGSPESVIAGGALRDLLNERPIKDVDIFLRSRGSQKKNRKFLEEVFEVAGLNVHEQQISYSAYGGGKRAKFPEPLVTRDQTPSEDKRVFRRDTEMESWKIIAGGSKTEYNVIFVDDKLDRKLSEQARSYEQRAVFTGGLLDSFDIGLCQIACDGDTIVSTSAYRDDVKHKRVSLILPNMASEDHLKRVVQKYADWQLNADAQKALAPKPPKPRSYSWY